MQLTGDAQHFEKAREQRQYIINVHSIEVRKTRPEKSFQRELKTCQRCSSKLAHELTFWVLTRAGVANRRMKSSLCLLH